MPVCGGSVKDVNLTESWREAGVRRLFLHELSTSGKGICRFNLVIFWPLISRICSHHPSNRVRYKHLPKCEVDNSKFNKLQADFFGAPPQRIKVDVGIMFGEIRWYYHGKEKAVFCNFFFFFETEIDLNLSSHVTLLEVSLLAESRSRRDFIFLIALLHPCWRELMSLWFLRVTFSTSEAVFSLIPLSTVHCS